MTMRSTNKYWLAFLLIFLLLTGCSLEMFQTPSMAEHVVTPTAVSSSSPSPTAVASPSPEPTSATPLPSVTATPEAVPTLPTLTETAVDTPPPPTNRQQLFDQLTQLINQAIDEATLLSALIQDSDIEATARQEALRSSVNALEQLSHQLTDFDVPQGGQQALNQTHEAVTQCADLATQIQAEAADSSGDAGSYEAELSSCIFALDKMRGLLTRQPAPGNDTTVGEVQLLGCEGVSTGFVPLSELGEGHYQGMMGGLYPNGENVRPPQHEAWGLELAEQIAPINGQIVLLSIGMSNTRNEFDFFIEAVANDPTINTAVLPVNGAIPGRPSQTIDSPDANYWTLVENRLRRAGVTPEDVQVIWLKQAHGYPKRPFPDDTLTFEEELRNIVQIIPIKFPNIKQVFLSSRIYAGYATTQLSPEPFAYQAGFGVKWLIEDQLNGNLPNAPWLSWGPYLWADGQTPRADDLVWECDDFEKDGIHPATGGREKVAQLLLDFFKTDVTTRGWFLGQE